MILAIDMGNTNIVVGGIDEEGSRFLERVTTQIHKTDLEYAVLLKSILEIHTVKKSDIDGAIVSSVVPPLNPVILRAVLKVTGLRALLVGPGMKTGMKILTDHPEAVGCQALF